MHLAYSYKACNAPKICRIFNEMGFLSEVVGDEFGIAEEISVPASKIIFNGPYKKREHVEKALIKNILVINVDSKEELDYINRILSKNAIKGANIGLRVRPSVSYPIAPHFGMDEELILKFAKKVIEMGANLYQIHAHIGTQITKLELYKELSEKMSNLAKKIEKEHNIELTINLGGGFALESTPEYFSRDRIPALNEYSLAISSGLNEDKEIFLEPGRTLIGPCAVLATKVISIKRPRNIGKIAIVDASYFDILSSAFLSHEVECISSGKEELLVETDVYGSSCVSADVIRVGAYLPSDLKEGDILLVKDAGAYSINISSHPMRPRPKIFILRENNEYEEVRRAFVE
ncbi:hypothetical protein D6D85_01520 [Candidatus Methanodesulfokora washburnensis]|uniref:Orn/DAP/Arg decarboxylase 2 N-terminal domain-containing protein n=1 Tax=Candidatus Methanodesulfokora washburnensis TaxID=2478471 RepID=A0A429GVW0_9CREN|nr:hypothetical protein D6D85_01520 [Candidatus Methanodesulfokores washburnensis]